MANQIVNGARCPVETQPAGPGVATYDFAPLAADTVMIGSSRVSARHAGFGGGLQLNARLYDVYPDGRAVMVDRGTTVVGSPNQTTVFDLHGNGWRFERGHRIRLELAQDDDLYVKASLQPSTLTISGVTLELPVREQGPTSVISAPSLASDVSRSASFRVFALPRSGERTGVGRFELDVRAPGKEAYTRLRGSGSGAGVGRLNGKPGSTYSLRARAFDRRGPAGPYSYATTRVPYDDAHGERRPSFTHGWSRAKGREAFLGGIRSASKRGERMRIKVRAGRVYLIGRRGPKGGRALLRVGRRKRTVSFYARKTIDRVVIASLAANPKRTSRVELRVLGQRSSKNGGRAAYVDAIGAVK